MHFFSKIFQHICVPLNLNFNESLTNDVVSFEQLGPGSPTEFIQNANSNVIKQMFLTLKALFKQTCRCLFVLGFYSPVNLLGTCRAQSVYLITLFPGQA